MPWLEFYTLQGNVSFNILEFDSSFDLTCMCFNIFQYHKQTQLESMASEKAALEFQLEKEIRRLQEAQVSDQLLS